MKTLSLILTALAMASCGVNQRSSAIEITKVLAGKQAAAGAACTVDPGDVEFDLLSINPAEVAGRVSYVLKNNLAQVNPNSLYSVNQTRFDVHSGELEYEVIGGAASVGNSSEVATGSVGANETKPIATFINGRGELQAVPAGSFVRVSAYFKGTLSDGSKANTGRRDYLFQVCSTPGCSSPCL